VRSESQPQKDQRGTASNSFSVRFRPIKKTQSSAANRASNFDSIWSNCWINRLEAADLKFELAFRGHLRHDGFG